MKILFVCGTPNHDPHQRITRPTGGILNSLTIIPEYLASKGHEVYVDSTYGKEETVNGVHYVTGNKTIGRCDVVVFNRNVLPKETVLQAKEVGAKVVWWLHDIVQLTYLKDDAFKSVDHVIALSNYCKNTYTDFYDLPKEIVSVIPNGVDKKVFYPATAPRNEHMVMTASALIKGYMPIPTVLDNLKRHDFDLDFRIYSSQKLHGMENSKEQVRFLRAMEKEGAHIYHPVSQEVLAHLLRQASCLLMPNSYPEICSNLLLQAQASGCPVVTSDIGSATEFIENGVTGVYTSKYKPHDYHSWIVEYTNKVLDVMLDKKFNQKLSENAPRDVKSWEQIGESWEHEMLQLM
ncbi:MAG: glycosyltransferase family 4 protein [Patescibacteria group bacterium]|nr:glycosyltransferase family 4 protein [Patescibacteria group bacterium]